MPREIAPGLRVMEALHDEPQYCDEIYCPCVIPKQLEDVRQGDALIFFCPSSRLSATVTPRTRGALLIGGHFLGNA